MRQGTGLRLQRWIPAAALLALSGVLFVRSTAESAPRPLASEPALAVGAPTASPAPSASRTTSSSAVLGATASRPSPSVAPAALRASAPGAEAVLDGSDPARPATMKVQEHRPYDRRHPAMAKAIEVQERHLDLLANPAVLGTAVGLKGEGEPAILVYTRVDAADVPATLEGIPVIVKRRDEFQARQQGPARTRDDVRARAGETSNAQRWERAVPIGVSTGHPSITAGTIGCRVKDADGKVYALSNNHVLANSNGASIGDAMLQPGPYDGGSAPGDVLGNLSAFEPIRFGGPPHRPQNVMDAAIALSTTAQLGNATPHTGGYGVPSSTTVLPAVGMKVTKVGRSTGHTSGTVDAINAYVSVSYGTGMAHFKNQIVIVPGSFSAGGDSGSLIVTNDGKNNPVGLLFAGSSADTIANEIDRVLSRFGVTVDDTTGTTNTAPVVTIASPSPGATFSSGTEITFAGSATKGEGNTDASDWLVWRTQAGEEIGTKGSFTRVLDDGSYTITATATDPESGLTGSASVSITVGGEPPPSSGTVGVEAVTYATTGGRAADKHLLITVSLKNPVGGASVSIRTSNSNGAVATGTGTTGSDGRVTFEWKNAPSGAYTTEVTNVTASGYVWDGVTPPNSFSK